MAAKTTAGGLAITSVTLDRELIDGITEIIEERHITGSGRFSSVLREVGHLGLAEIRRQRELVRRADESEQEGKVA